MTVQDDPRILPWHAERLAGVTLVHQPWESANPQNDHDHCAFCWAKFADYDDCLHEGYSTEKREDWICEACFTDFRDRFQWRVKR